MIFDPLYLVLLAPALLLSLWAQFKVKRAFSRYKKVPSSSGMTGARIAQEILSRNGLHEVKIEQTQGMLSDHYDPRHRVLRLSPDVYQGRSVAAAGIAAHECGHALQHQAAYAPLVLRQAMAPMAILGSNLSWILILAGLFLNLLGLMWVGIALFSVAVLFSVVTLPVEFDASRRALASLSMGGMLPSEQVAGARNVLTAAALTYIAATLISVMQLLYWLGAVRRS
jgi:hypothetical protein